jgi:prolyl 4-hydroxylase
MQKEELAGDRIFVIHDFLTPQECQGFINQSEQAGYEEATITTGAGFVMRKDIRNNTRLIIDDTDMATRLFARVRPYLPACIGEWELKGLNERFRFYRYDVGETFRPHYDGSFVRSSTEESLLTLLFYLNDDFVGGETKFYEDNVDSGTRRERTVVQPVQGQALVFWHRQLHEGATVESGRKYVLRTDVMYEREPSMLDRARAARALHYATVS